MHSLASLLLEYLVVMSMKGAGRVIEPQLIAEIGAMRRFVHKSALVASAEVDASPFQYGNFEIKSHVSQRGSPTLRRTLFQIFSTKRFFDWPTNRVHTHLKKAAG